MVKQPVTRVIGLQRETVNHPKFYKLSPICQQTTTNQPGTVVARQILLTDGYKAPERLLSWHVHQEHGGNWSLRLTVAVSRVVHRVRLQNPEEIFLPEPAFSQHAHLPADYPFWHEVK